MQRQHPESSYFQRLIKATSPRGCPSVTLEGNVGNRFIKRKKGKEGLSDFGDRRESGKVAPYPP